MKDKKIPAFPHQKEDGTPYWGMDLRDWFAGQALASVGSSWGDEETRAEYAKRAYLMADAMIKARS